jgi:glycosyltransferase involved in cell wall biosynthesis
VSVPSPRVTVVIPCYNAAAHIVETLESVRGQTFQDHEVVLVNDGSPDTPELEAAIEPFREQIRYLAQENRGPGGARNSGIRAARGEWVAFLDSDDVWLPDFLAGQFAVLAADPSLDMVYADALLFGDTPHDGKTFMELSPSRGPVTFEALVSLRCMVITSCVVARRSSLIEAGLFDERFFHSEDFDLWVRLAHRGGRIGYQRRVLARHRAHAASLGATENSLISGQMRISEKLLETLPLSNPERALLLRHTEWCRAHLRLRESKQLLLTGRYGEASRALADADRVLRSWKLRLSRVGLRLAPALVRRLYLTRQGASMASASQEG